MRPPRPLLLVAIASLAASCALFSSRYRPPRAPKVEAEKIKFPWGEPKERVTLTGVWLRAVTLALDDYLPEEESERAKNEGAWTACVSRRDSYDVEAFVWSPRSESDPGDGGEVGSDGGTSSEDSDGGSDAWAQPGMPKAPPIIYVQITLIPDACDFGESPPVDFGAVYAIDTVNWRILAAR
jgi:hypothetical protein